MKRPYECKYIDCDKKFTTRFSLRRHVSTHAAAKQYICVICYKKFALGQYLKEHTYIHTGQKPFKCPYAGCTKAFRQAGKLSLHKKLHQNKIFTVQKVKRSSAEHSDGCCDNDFKIQLNLKKPAVSACNEEHSISTDTDNFSSSAPMHEHSNENSYTPVTLPSPKLIIEGLGQNHSYPSMVMSRCLPQPEFRVPSI